MIAVIVPAHDEQQQIAACLASIMVALRSPGLAGEAGQVVVALDSCRDDTGLIAASMGATTVSLAARNVGMARALGAQWALDHGARWLAFTDADSEVDPEWLSRQLALASDVVCGTVAVREWGTYGERMRRHFAGTYTDADDHQHIHGANLGVGAEAYRRAGGFKPLASSEDVALVEALRLSGASIAWSAAPRVFTSSRSVYRAPGGFGETLARVDAAMQLASVARAPDAMLASA